MAIKDWTSRFSTGLGLDTTLAGGMETLRGLADETRVSQPHALRDSVIELGKQALGSPWFTWNDADLLQFDSPVVGADVTGSSASVVVLAGLNWIEIDVTATAGGTLWESGLALPITQTPPSADYVVVAEFISTVIGATNIGAAVAARFDGTDTGYTSTILTTGGPQQELARWVGNTKTQLGPLQSDPDISAINQGARFVLKVRGTGTESLVTQDFGNKMFAVDTSPVTPTNQAALVGSTNGAATQTTNLFRNIRCYALVD